MNRKIKIPVVLLIVLVSFSCVTQDIQNSEPMEIVSEESQKNTEIDVQDENQVIQILDYTDLVNLCLSGEEINYTELRLTYTQSDYYNVHGSDTASRIKDLYRSESYEEAGDLIHQNVTKHLGEFNFVYYSILVFNKLEDDRAGFFRKILWEIMDSIEESGDGLTEETAYFVISVDEEYIFMNIKNIDHKTQSLIENNGHTFDMFDIVPNDNYNSEVIYFNIDKVFEAYDF